MNPLVHLFVAVALVPVAQDEPATTAPAQAPGAVRPAVRPAIRPPLLESLFPGAPSRAAASADDDGVPEAQGQVLELYDVRDLVAPKRPVEDLAELLRANLALGAEDPNESVHAVSGTLVVRARPADQRRVREFLEDLRRALPQVKVTILGCLDMPRLAGADLAAPTVNGVRLTSLPSGQVGAVRAALHAGDRLVPLPYRTGGGEGQVVLQGDVQARQHGPVAEDEVVSGGSSRDRTWLVGYDEVTGVEGHPAGVVVPRLETLREGVDVECSYSWIRLDGESRRLRVKARARLSTVPRPVATRETTHGSVHAPEPETRTVDAEFELEAVPGCGFVIAFEAEERGAPEPAVMVFLDCD